MPDYNQMFQTHPERFFKKYAVTPPASGHQQQNDMGELFDSAARDAAYQGLHDDGDIMTRETVIAGNQVVWIKFTEEPPNAHKPGAITFDVSLARQRGYVPIHFLPWESRRVVHMKIPAFNAPTPGAVTSDDNPNRFFTAALSGCSIFARGDARSPEVYHGGVDGKELHDPVQFWRDCIAFIEQRSPVPAPQFQGEVNRAHYAKDPATPGTTPQANAFKAWYQNPNKQSKFAVTDVVPWGCVFGIRKDTGEWEFSLQENATVFYKSFVKKWRTDEFDNGIRKHQGFFVRSEEKPGIVSGRRTVYYTERRFAKPMHVTQFYPANGPAVLTTRSSFSS
jgi:hypothetical protein